MNALLDWLGQPPAQRLGWTLLHFVWQGALLALLYAAVRAVLHRRGANARYLAGCLVLFWMAAAPAWTFVRLGSTTNDTPRTPTESVGSAFSSELVSPAVPVALGSGAASGFLSTATTLATAAVPWLTLFWLAGVAVLSLRLSAGWVKVRGWPRQAVDGFETELHARLRELRARLGVSRPVRLLRSAAVRVPTLTGWLKPVILLPASTLSGLTPQQLDFILAHELAHVRRGDAWVNLFQTLLETVLFYHPAVWWVSRCVRDEREHCCDDLALSVCGDRLAGAQALTTLEELRQWHGAVVLAANGGSLLARVRRLLGVSEGPRNWRRTVGNALLGFGLLVLLAGVAGTVMARPLYSASCRLLSQRSVAEPGEPSSTPAPVASDLRWLRTERELATSVPVLHEVVRRLGLVTRWRLDGYGDRDHSEREAVRRLRSRLRVSAFEDSYLLEVRDESPDRQEAAELANAVAEAYVQVRRTRQEQAAQLGLQKLRDGVTRWTEIVQARQSQVDETRERVGVDDSAGDGPSPPATLAREMASAMAQQLTYAKAEYVLYNSKLEQLRAMDSNVVRRSILTLLPGEEILPKLLVDYATLEQELTKWRQEYADEHPLVQKTRQIAATTEVQINERVSGMIAGLEYHVISLRARLDELQAGVEKSREQLVAEGRHRRELSRLERDLEAEQRIRDALYLRAMQEEVDAKIQPTAVVEIVDRAVPTGRPSSRQVPPWTRLAWGGGALCCVGGLGMRAFAGRGRPNPPGAATAVQPASVSA